MSEYNFGVPDTFSAAKLKKEINKKKRDVVRYLPSIIVWVLLFVAAIATFTEFEFVKVGTVSFAASSLLFAICTYLTIFLKKYTGMARGKNDEEYVAAKKTHEEKCRLVSDKLTGENSLAEFCIDWTQEEADRARKAILTGTGVTDEQWAKYSALGASVKSVIHSPKKLKKALRRGKIGNEEYTLLEDLRSLPPVQKMAICRACLVEKQRLTPVDLIYESKTKEARERTPFSLKNVERKQDVSQVIRVTVMMFGVMAIVPEVAAFDFTIRTIIFCLTRVSSLLYTGFISDMRGEALYTVDAIENLTIQDSLLDEALKWRDRREEIRTESHQDMSLDSI